jgi:DNA-binding transcriptional MocR family regulator
MTADQALSRIRRHQIDALPGTVFASKALGYEAIRMAFSLYPEEDLATAGAAITRALTE